MSRSEMWKQFSNQYAAAFPGMAKREISLTIDKYKRREIDIATLANTRFVIAIDMFVAEALPLIGIGRQEEAVISQIETVVNKMIGAGKLTLASEQMARWLRSITITGPDGTSYSPNMSSTVARYVAKKMVTAYERLNNTYLRDVVTYIKLLLVVMRNLLGRRSDIIIKETFESIVTDKEKSTKVLKLNESNCDMYANMNKYIGQNYPMVSRMFC